MAPFRFVLLATICAAVMCCAASVQLIGINRIVVTDGRIDASASTFAATSIGGTVDIHFGSDTFPLEALIPVARAPAAPTRHLPRSPESKPWR